MPTRRWENHKLIAEFRWLPLTLRCLVLVTQAAWQALINLWQEASHRMAQTECTHPPELRVCRANQWASMDVCDRKRRGCGAILNYTPTAMTCAQRNAKTKEKAKKKDSVNINQRAALIASGVLEEKEWDNVCPRCNRKLYVFRTAARPIIRCRGWDLTGTPCTSIKACQDEAINFKDINTNRTEDGNLATGSGGLVRRTTRRLGDEHVAWTRRWIPKSNSQQRLDSSDASPDVKSRVGARTIRSVAVHSPTIPTPSTPAAARSVIQPGVVADVPPPRRERQVHWGSVEHGYADGLHQHLVTPSDNHELSRCVEAQPIFEIKGEALSVFPQSVVNCPFELHREDKIPGFAVMIREGGIWPRRCPFSVFLSPVGAKDRSHEFRAAGRDTLLGGIIAQISDLVEFYSSSRVV